jgi:hypothetical protein
MQQEKKKMVVTLIPQARIVLFLILVGLSRCFYARARMGQDMMARIHARCFSSVLAFVLQVV